MSRNIKFRVWDILNKRILHYGDIMHLPMWEVLPGTPEQRAFEVMQYTGLKDKNGKEIYEGDILEIDDDFFRIGLDDKYGEVKFDNGRFYVATFKKYYNECFMHFEVAGNIYENPELLEGDKK